MFRRIRNLREDHDLTQKEIASMLSLSANGYGNYETGRCEIPTAVLIQLADFYDTTVDYLLERTDNPRPYPKGK